MSTDFLGNDLLPSTTPNNEEKTLAILSHILTVVSSFLAPLIIYLLKKDESPYGTEHAKESLNFQLTILLGYIASGILAIVLVGLLLIWALGIINLILVIVATIRASENKLYRYPFSIKFIK